ncbi:MAG: hypothetical protein OEW19_06505 [Acidobacteriota bacterium]|nr:hypothetical protein [Acidobacteriota bacterium]
MDLTPLTGDPLWSAAAYRRLALRVILQALHDLDCPSPELQRSARSFLNGNPPFDLWCAIARVLPARVTRAATDRDTPGGRRAREASLRVLEELASSGSPVS